MGGAAVKLRLLWLCRALRGVKRSKRFLLVVLFVMLIDLAAFGWWIKRRPVDDAEEDVPGKAFSWRQVTQPLPRNDGDTEFKIVACVKVSTETPYLLEFIEFHRIQGVDKFVFYHEGLAEDPLARAASLELEWLPELYREAARAEKRGKVAREQLITVLPAGPLIPDLWPALSSVNHTTYVVHRMQQPLLVSDCLERYKHRTRYLIHLDVDEFAYSPRFPTLWDYLEFERTRQQKWRRLLDKRYVGIFLPSVNFGSSGQMWDFHNFWTPDAASGTVRAFFDPRDSSLFRFLNSSVAAGEVPPHSLDELVKKLDAFRLDRLKQTPVTGDVKAFVKEMTELFRADYFHRQSPTNSSNDGDDFLSAAAFSSQQQQQRSSSDSILLHPYDDDDLKQTSRGLLGNQRLVSETAIVQWASKMLRELSDTNRKIATATRAFNRFTNKDNNTSRRQAKLTQKAAVDLYSAISERARLFYPLVIEEHVRRASGEAYGFSPRGTGKMMMRQVFQACQYNDSERMNYLSEVEGLPRESTNHMRTAKTFNTVCEGRTPPSLTVLGKMVYFTWTVRRSTSSREHAKLRGCHKPGVHYCSHKIYEGSAKLGNPKDVRIDHHQFRSLQRRSLSMPHWRGGPMGYYGKYNYTIVQRFMSPIVDGSKLRFVPELRRRLGAFLHVLPKQPSYRLRETQAMQFIVDAHAVLRRCSRLELIGEHQVMCPKDFPFVGYVFIDAPPPSPFLPYCWCTNLPVSDDVSSWMNVWVLRAMAGVPKDSNVTREELLMRHIRFCPGYGETRCCDYDDALVEWQTRHFPPDADFRRDKP